MGSQGIFRGPVMGYRFLELLPLAYDGSRRSYRRSLPVTRCDKLTLETDMKLERISNIVGPPGLRQSPSRPTHGKS